MVRAVRRLAVAVVIVGALLVAVDRGAAFTASRLAARHADGSGGHDANVRILGFPFLTQAFRGRYDTVTVTERGLGGRGLRIDSLHAVARGVHISTPDALAGLVRSVPVDHVNGTAVVTYASLESSIGTLAGFGRGLTLTLSPRSHDELTATLSGPLGLHVSVPAPVPVVSGGRLQLGTFVQHFASVLPDRIANDLALPLPSLPYGLTLGSAVAEADGLHLTVSGRDVAFH